MEPSLHLVLKVIWAELLKDLCPLVFIDILKIIFTHNYATSFTIIKYVKYFVNS